MTRLANLPAFRPPFWGRNPHLQTLLGRRSVGRIWEPRWEGMSLRLADGDILTFRIARGTEPVVVYLFPAPGETADAPVLRRAAARFGKKGYTVVALNHRGSAEGRWLATRSCHAGSSVDLGAVVRTVRVFFPESRHLAVGYGLAGNMLLLLMGRDWDAGAPDAGIAVCPPVDLASWTERQRRGFGFWHGWRARRVQAQEVRDRSDVGLIPPVPLSLWGDQQDFDTTCTAPLAGFGDLEAYHRACSAGPYLSRITAPTVILCAEDDPLAPASEIHGFTHGPGLTVHQVSGGGHCGFLAEGERPWSIRRWLEDALDAWIQEFVAGADLTVCSAAPAGLKPDAVSGLCPDTRGGA